MPDLNSLPALLQELSDRRPTRPEGGISGTDIKKIMRGEWVELYLEKTGQKEPEPLLELPPLIGKYLAPLHIAWFEWQTGRVVDYQEEVSTAEVKHEAGYLPYVTLDGRVRHPDKDGIVIPWEAKIVNGFMQRDALIAREYPQLQWQMLCENSDQLELSVLYLNSRWESMLIDRDNEVIEQLEAEAARFWQHVVDHTMPQDQVEQKVAPVIERVDMRESGQWAKFEDVWLKTRDAKKSFEKADKALKKEIPKDAANGFGYALSFTRNKAGAVTLLPLTQEQKAKFHTPPQE